MDMNENLIYAHGDRHEAEKSVSSNHQLPHQPKSTENYFQQQHYLGPTEPVPPFSSGFDQSQPQPNFNENFSSPSEQNMQNVGLVQSQPISNSFNHDYGFPNQPNEVISKHFTNSPVQNCPRTPNNNECFEVFLNNLFCDYNSFMKGSNPPMKQNFPDQEEYSVNNTMNEHNNLSQLSQNQVQYLPTTQSQTQIDQVQTKVPQKKTQTQIQPQPQIQPNMQMQMQMQTHQQFQAQMQPEILTHAQLLAQPYSINSQKLNDFLNLQKKNQSMNSNQNYSETPLQQNKKKTKKLNSESSKSLLKKMRPSDAPEKNLQDSEIAAFKSKKWIPNNKRCTCSSSFCQKCYCVCFKAGRLCTSACACSGCKNCEGNPNAEKIWPKTTFMGSCKCNKECRKLYCECKKNNVRCSVMCICENCQNGKETKTFDLPNDDRTFRNSPFVMTPNLYNETKQQQQQLKIHKQQLQQQKQRIMQQQQKQQKKLHQQQKRQQQQKLQQQLQKQPNQPIPGNLGNPALQQRSPDNSGRSQLNTPTEYSQVSSYQQMQPQTDHSMDQPLSQPLDPSPDKPGEFTEQQITIEEPTFINQNSDSRKLDSALFPNLFGSDGIDNYF